MIKPQESMSSEFNKGKGRSSKNLLSCIFVPGNLWSPNKYIILKKTFFT